MTRLLVAAGLLAWAGGTVLLGGWRRLARPSLAQRLAPFSARLAGVRVEHSGVVAVQDLRQLAAEEVRRAGDRLASLVGVDEPLAVRLERVHSRLTPTEFRLRQCAWAGAGAGFGLAVTALGAPAPLAITAVLGAPLLAFLVIEQQLSRASARWRERVAQELPVVAEQLAMLLDAGYSLGSSISRLAVRGRGCCATDLASVANRVRQGVPEPKALQEWSRRVRVEALDRLVAVLVLDASAADLGRLVNAESCAARHELHRRTVAVIERRSQQVWIPVSVATLVPGVILLAVPFLAALRLFANA
jgi:tight adherence protein C